MVRIHTDFNTAVGKMKPMNAVNNGPVGSVRTNGNVDAYRAARFPYARLHDASFCSGYGGEFSVDVHRIFRNFDADENDAANYVFAPTDAYLKRIKDAGTEIFYRLGASIEHGYKHGTYPPRDFLKWARICEHIILHYNEGWADGYHLGITYFEIWNEADCESPDGSSPCWQGTHEEFLELYCATSTYLKSRFPHLKIGGPSVAWTGTWLMKALVPAVRERGAVLDFFSFHKYATTVEQVVADIRAVREYLDGMGFTDTELILNEWNYVKGWLGDEWKYSVAAEKGLKGASFALGVMAAAQASPLDMLMYYDARPCGMNGIFDTDTLAPLKSYYAFSAFADLRDLGDCSALTVEGSDEGVYAVAASNGREHALLLTAYSNDDEAPKREITAEIRVANPGTLRAEYYLLNGTENMSLVREELFTANVFRLRLNMKNWESYKIRFVPEE